MLHWFTHPELLTALVALPLVGLLAWRASRQRRRALVEFTGALVPPKRRFAVLTGLAVTLGMVCLAVGMAGPRWGRDWSQSTAPGRDLVVVLDLSRSMFAESPSRLERARSALLDLVRALQRLGGQRVALVVFAGEARLVCPLTHDVEHFREAVEAIDLEVPDARLGSGTRIGEGLSLALSAFTGRSSEVRDVLLLSDGDDPRRDGEWSAATEAARIEGVPIHCIGIGDPHQGHRIPYDSGWLMHDGQEVRTRLEEAPLRGISQRTNGQFRLVGMRPFALGEHYPAMVRETVEDSPEVLAVLKQRPTWFLLSAFLLLCLPLLLPGGKRT